MKDIYKNPIFYYILIPILAGVWPLLVWGVYLPDVEENYSKEKKQYKKAEIVIGQILTIDPERLDGAGSKGEVKKFDYMNAIDNMAGRCNIASANCKIASGMIRKSKGQKTQTANVGLTDIDITRFAEFLSRLQLRWANLQCEKVKLTKKKGVPDQWNIDLGFRYYF